MLQHFIRYTAMEVLRISIPIFLIAYFGMQLFTSVSLMLAVIITEIINPICAHLMRFVTFLLLMYAIVYVVKFLSKKRNQINKKVRLGKETINDNLKFKDYSQNTPQEMQYKKQGIQKMNNDKNREIRQVTNLQLKKQSNIRRYRLEQQEYDEDQILKQGKKEQINQQYDVQKLKELETKILKRIKIKQDRKKNYSITRSNLEYQEQYHSYRPYTKQQLINYQQETHQQIPTKFIRQQKYQNEQIIRQNIISNNRQFLRKYPHNYSNQYSQKDVKIQQPTKIYANYGFVAQQQYKNKLRNYNEGNYLFNQFYYQKKRQHQKLINLDKIKAVKVVPPLINSLSSKFQLKTNYEPAQNYDHLLNIRNSLFYGNGSVSSTKKQPRINSTAGKPCTQKYIFTPDPTYKNKLRGYNSNVNLVELGPDGKTVQPQFIRYKAQGNSLQSKTRNKSKR